MLAVNVPSIATSSLKVASSKNDDFPVTTRFSISVIPGKDILSAQSFPQIVTFSNTESPDLVNIGFDGTGQFAILGYNIKCCLNWRT